ncbi:MAG: transposase [Candidatus Baltobacteraceae bacterium]
MPQKYTRFYPADFRQKVVELARVGRSADDLAAEFKLARQTVRNWIKQADCDAGRRSDGLTTAEWSGLDFVDTKFTQPESARTARG